MSVMLREIHEQPAALDRTLRAEQRRMSRLGSRLRARSIPLIVLVARGTSDNAALFGRYLLEITTGIPVSLAAPSVHTLYRRRLALGGGDFDPLRRIPDYAAAALDLEPRIAGVVERYRFMERCVVVGRALNYASASELAIKLMETSYVLAERFSSADFLHGPVALV